jgi:hypothetical protein
MLPYGHFSYIGKPNVPKRCNGHGDDVGTLVPGKIGNIFIVGGNPLVDMKALQNIEAILQEGAVIERKRETAASRPRTASAEKGEVYLERLADFVVSEILRRPR